MRGMGSAARWTGRSSLAAGWLWLVAVLATTQAWAQDATALGSVRSEVDRILQDPKLAGARVGILVRSLDEGQTIYERNALETLTTASNTKLITTATALSVLGTDFYLETRFGLRGRHGDGELFEGDLVVEGSGDPGIGARFHEGDPVGAFRRLAQALRERRVAVIAGDLVLDDRAFDQQYVEPGWPQNQLDRAYAAPVSALALTENCIDVLVQPSPTTGGSASASTEPPTDVLAVRNECSTVPRLGRGEGPKVYRAGDTIRVGGKVRHGDPSSRIVLSVPDPLAYFGDVLKRTLVEEGIRIEGRILRARGEPLTEAERIYMHRTPLDQVVTVINKESQNFFAEQLYKRIARHGFPDRSATFALAGAVVKRHLENLGIPADQVRSADGSGLSRDNAFAPAHLVRLLEAMYNGPHQQVFVASLPISGVDGTLENRLGGAAYRGRVRAKTGYISRVSALSGYLRTRGERTLVFSILMNDFSGSNREMKRIQDAICRALIDGL